jgi:hypothetical protein
MNALNSICEGLVEIGPPGWYAIAAIIVVGGVVVWWIRG